MMPPEISTRVFSPMFPAIEPALTTQFDANAGALWISQHPKNRRVQNMSRETLAALQDILEQVGRHDPHWHDTGSERPVHYLVLRSEHPRHFNLGVDLEYLLGCLEKREAAALQRYATQLMGTIYQWATQWNGEATTIALVQGRALGAGFEMALSADHVVAEEHAEFGFPEIVYGLFPGNGAMSLLGRRVGLATAQRLMQSGRVYGAAELMELGVIDQVCPSGRGEAVVREFIHEHAQRRGARLALQRARMRMQPLDRAEFDEVVADWLETASRLEARQLHMLQSMLRMQRSDSTH